MKDRSDLALGCETSFSVLQACGMVCVASHLVQLGVGRRPVRSPSQVDSGLLERWLGDGAL